VRPPDALVLGGGGLLGEIWMNAVLTGINDGAGIDVRDSPGFVGTSAGSIVAVSLAAGVDPYSRLGDGDADGARRRPTARADIGPDQAASYRALRGLIDLGASAAAPLAAIALGWGAAAAAGAVARRALLAGLPTGRRSLAYLASSIERLGVRWDGRLQIAAVDVDSGRRVMFGRPGAPGADVSQAVQASCAIPGVFRPIRVDGRSYVDGGVWSPTNLDAAQVSRGSRVLCLNPTGSLRPTPRAPAGALGTVSRSIAATESLALKQRGAAVTVINPDDASRRAMGLNFFDTRRRAAVVEAGVAQGKHAAAQLARAA
jgi:NTE family protein